MSTRTKLEIPELPQVVEELKGLGMELDGYETKLYTVKLPIFAVIAVVEFIKQGLPLAYDRDSPQERLMLWVVGEMAKAIGARAEATRVTHDVPPEQTQN